MKKGFYATFLILISAVLILIFIVIGKEMRIQSQIYDLNELFISHPIEQNNIDISKYEKYIEEYILNQRNLKEMWWNTIINQSGLSILFTIITLFITVSLSWITQNQIQDRYKKDLQNTTRYANDITADVLTVTRVYSGPPGMVSYEEVNNIAFNKINIFNQLKILTRESLDELYYESLENLSSKLWGIFQGPYNKIATAEMSQIPGPHKVMEYDEPIRFNEIENEIKSIFYRITDPGDRVRIIEFMEEHFESDENLHATPNREETNKKILKYIKSLTSLDNKRLQNRTS